MVKSSRIDLALEVGKYLILGFAPIADCVEDQRGFKYLDDRDLINFVDGTENPRGTERAAAVLVPSGTYAGGTHLLIQTYLDRQAERGLLRWTHGVGGPRGMPSPSRTRRASSAAPSSTTSRSPTPRRSPLRTT